jgi:Tfp pilus assembly protein PilZ
MAKVVGHSTKNCQERLLSYIACKVEDNTFASYMQCVRYGTVFMPIAPFSSILVAVRQRV